jgi:hypothetical protein
MAEFLEYTIKGATLKAIADKIREKKGAIPNQFTPSVIDGNGSLTREIEVYYTEYVDTHEGYETVEGNDGFNFVGYTFSELNGTTVPVLLDDYDVNLADRYYYEGRAEINGETYDKWRKIDERYTLNSTARCYKYTEIITKYESISTVNIPNEIENVYSKGYEDGGSGGIAADIIYDSATKTLSITTT